MNILHSRLRNSCSSLKYDIFCVNKINSTTCECSLEIENTQYFLLDCPLYNKQRTTLREISAFGNINLNELLYDSDSLSMEDTSLIFRVVQKVIKDTGRFQI